MNCEKTGCYIYHQGRGEFFRGDAFAGDNFHIFRLRPAEFKPSQDFIHYIVLEDDYHWTGNPSTMLVYDQMLKSLGYDGQSIASQGIFG